MVIARSKEIQIQDLLKAGYPQRNIATEADVCLTTVNNRNKLFKISNSTKLSPSKRTSKYDLLEEIARQRIRYYLTEEKKFQKFSLIQVLEKLHKDSIEVSKSKIKEWIRLERNRLKESYLDIYHAPPTTS